MAIEGANRPVLVSEVLGELAWLMSQSPRHGAFPVAEINWLLMPPIMQKQFHLFREGSRPVGAALWAFPPADAEARLARALASPDNRLRDDEWQGGEHLWLVDLIAPFATAENRQIEIMIADLMTGPFKGKEFRMLTIDPSTGQGSATIVDANAGGRLASQTAEILRQTSHP